jgi:hypothetical protein
MSRRTSSFPQDFFESEGKRMKIFPLTIYVLLKPFIQILPSDSKKSLWDSRTTATLDVVHFSKNILSKNFQTQFFEKFRFFFEKDNV